jgi:polysaccharide pyruvyl transferase WcaK-like protein
MALYEQQRTISIMGTFGEGNTGDDILLLATIQGIKSRCPECRIVVFTGKREHTQLFLLREGIPLDSFNLIYTGRWGLREPGLPFLRSLSWIGGNFLWISRSDLLLIGPGTQFQDVTRRFRLLFFLSRAFLAIVLRTPYAFIGMGYWRVTGWLCRKALRFTANHSAFLSTRDQGSACELAALGIKHSKIIPLADVSFIQARSSQEAEV